MFLERRAVVPLVVLWAPMVLAQRESTREALARFEETVQMRVEDGGLDTRELMPAIVVSTSPAVEESRNWYPTAALESLVRIFGSDGLRSCEACMSARLYAAEGRVEQVTAPLGAVEIRQLDESTRGTATPAKTAIWLDETLEGVSLRIISLQNSRIVMADNFDPRLTAPTRSRRTFTLARELDRRSRGDSLTHTFLDLVLYPGQHVSFDWAEQWGDTNANLSGLAVSFFDPVLGIGGAYYRVVPSAWNIVVGGKLLMSVPTALVQGISGRSVEVVDPLLNVVFIARMPIARSNYGITVSASTNGRIGVGVSMMNLTLLPFLP